MAATANHQPLVTVGICCYNREQGFKETLQCITTQTYNNIEIIISQDFNEVHDFTTIVNDLNDGRVTFYKQPQRLSMYNNFCFLLEKANGEYFMWAADDDWWAPGFIEKIVSQMKDNPSATAGFSDFMEVNELGERMLSYPDHLPLLLGFTLKNDVKRIRNYINQFEGFGKANLFYSIFKTEAVRTKKVIEILKKGDLPGDMLINLSVLTKGELAVVPELLRTCTFTPVKGYAEELYTPQIKNLLVMAVNWGGMQYMYKKWSNYLYSHFDVIYQSELSRLKKIPIYLSIIVKIAAFYYDIVCVNVRLKGFDIFRKIKRRNILG